MAYNGLTTIGRIPSRRTNRCDVNSMRLLVRSSRANPLQDAIVYAIRNWDEVMRNSIVAATTVLCMALLVR